MAKPYPPATPPHAGAAELTQHGARDADMPALGHTLRALVADPGLTEALMAVTGASLTGVAVDWPRLVARDELGRWLRAADTLIELTGTPACAPVELALALHAESATVLVERILGGGASSAVPSAAGALGEAECGVLAYAAARLCAAHPSGLVVRDVRIAPPPAALPEPLVLWPLSLQGSLAPLTGLLLLAPAVAARAEALYPVELVLRDALDDDAPLTPGDVLTSDRWTLTDTTEGLTGPLRVAAAGIETELVAQLARGVVTVSGAAATPRPDDVTLVLTTHALSLAEIAALASGTPWPFPDVGAQPARLRRGTTDLAEGTLIVHRGALGLRVDAT